VLDAKDRRHKLRGRDCGVQAGFCHEVRLRFDSAMPLGQRFGRARRVSSGKLRASGRSYLLSACAEGVQAVLRSV
jgi:hypothetical protein